MWIIGKVVAFLKDSTFSELYTECRLAAPGARLSYTLRTKLHTFSREDRKEIVTRLKEGCAPLFLACEKGNVEIVEYLISTCEADVEQCATYEGSDYRMSAHYITPLRCAAAAGKLSVVKCLIENGANVNSVSDTGWTPVKLACFMNHLDTVTYLVENGADILKPDYDGRTCLMMGVQSVPLCEFLLKHGADVNAQDIEFETALHYAIRGDCFETTKLLLENGADPLIMSRYGDDALQTACLEGATQIFDYLCEKYNYSLERIAEAHELMGATFLDEDHDLQKTLHYWRKALALRQENGGIVLLKRHSSIPRPAYLNAMEFSSQEELESLALDLDAMQIQSLLLRERILGPLRQDIIFRLICRAEAYLVSLQYQRCIDLWRYALELRIQKDSLLHSEVCFEAQALVHFFLDLYENHGAGILHEKLRYDDIIGTIRLLSNQFPMSMELLCHRPVFKRQQDNFDKILKILAHLFYFLNVIPKTPEQFYEMKCLIREVLYIGPRTSTGDSMLHLVVSKAETMDIFFEDPHTAIFPDPGVTQLLLECGAHVDATNDNLSTPLHIAALQINFHPLVVNILLEHGAHIDRRNSNGNQPHYMLGNIPHCTVNPLQYISLKCLAVRKIIERGILYSGEVPVVLEGFISIH